jgi:hypothetical protein
MPTMVAPGAGFLPGVRPDHAAALLVPLVLPLAIWLLLGAARLASGANLGIARSFIRGYEDSPPLTRVTAFLLVLAGAIHLVLVPGHLGQDAGLAFLFDLDGVAFLGAGIAAFVADRWRAPAAALLVATLAAYVFWLGAGREQADLVGATTYVVELIALGVIWIAPETTPARGVPGELTSARASTAASGYRRELTPGGRP